MTCIGEIFIGTGRKEEYYNEDTKGLQIDHWIKINKKKTSII